MERMTQCEKIVAWMKETGGITARDAIFFGCMRLASRIHDLKRMGYGISSEMIKVVNRDGSETYVACYRLESEPEEGGEDNE